MANTRQHPILHYLRQVLGTPTGGSVADADLLRRFVNERDEAAFELLLWRHAGMVVHVCRQLLGEGSAAEDAFQATFLVFVRKAGSISRRESLGGWLYRVAYRIALKARAEIKRRMSANVKLDRIEAPADAETAEQRELRRTICEEVNRLPAKYRAPIVACYFEGKTHEEAAHQLGWPRGTVAGRLARARELLRRRLVRRGVTLTMSALAAALSVRTVQAALTGLIESTMQTAKLFAAGQAASAAVSPHIAALAEGVMQAMYWTRAKIVMVVLLIAGLGGAGATLWARQRSSDGRRAETVIQVPAGGTVEVKGDEVPSGNDARQPQDADKLARDMAQSRLNLRLLAQAMRVYNLKAYGHLPPPAIYDKNGKALLSWRVALLPFLDPNDQLYKQFHLDEPWDSSHNRKLLDSTVPKVYAPVGRPATAPVRTYYQLFVSPARGSANLPKGTGGALLTPQLEKSKMDAVPAPEDPNRFLMAGGIEAAFVKRWSMRSPAHFRDGMTNTILIVEAGNSVPWTKPEDLHYAADEPLPELGGLFGDVFHAAFADGEVHTLTKKYDEKQLRAAITANGGEKLDLTKIEAPRRIIVPETEESRRQLRQEGERMEELLRINEKLREEMKRSDEQWNRLLDDKQKLLEEMLQDLKRSRRTGIHQPKKPVEKKGP